jgi:hypothetical protein
MVAKEALTNGNADNQTRKTPIPRLASKLIKDKPDELAPTSP